jgi:hypothetical protein
MLIGMTAPMLGLLDGPLGESAALSCCPFPSPHFEPLLDEMEPNLVVVDVTYLDEAAVRPLLMHRLAGTGTILVFATATGYGWVDDPLQGRSGYFPDVSPERLLGLINRPHLRVVEPR